MGCVQENTNILRKADNGSLPQKRHRIPLHRIRTDSSLSYEPREVYTHASSWYPAMSDPGPDFPNPGNEILDGQGISLITTRNDMFDHWTIEIGQDKPWDEIPYAWSRDGDIFVDDTGVEGSQSSHERLKTERLMVWYPSIYSDLLTTPRSRW